MSQRSKSRSWWGQTTIVSIDARNRKLCIVQNFKLVFSHFNINEPRLGLNDDAINTRASWTERSAILGDHRALVTRVAYLNVSALFQGLNMTISCHREISFLSVTMEQRPKCEATLSTWFRRGRLQVQHMMSASPE